LNRSSNVNRHKDAEAFDKYLSFMLKDDEQYYLLLDEIQLVDRFEFVLNGLIYKGVI